MGWETKAVLAFAACAGLAAVWYYTPFPAFFCIKKKKKTASEITNNTSEETVNECKDFKESSSGADAQEEKMSDNLPEETSSKNILEQSVVPCQLEDLPELNNKYDLCETLGAGSFGTVKLAIDITTKEKVAIKSILKTSANLSVLKFEIDALQTLKHHQHVNRMYEMFETSEHIFLVLELCQNGNLLDYIDHHEKLHELEARRILRQIVSAVSYVHSEGYVHRDLKPENIMMGENNNIKLIDFGLCSKPEGGLDTPLEDMCGTPYYMSPEIFTGDPYLGAEADIWSIGIILYHMLCGTVPYHMDCDGDNRIGSDEEYCQFFDNEKDESFYRFYCQISAGFLNVPEFMSQESEWLLFELLEAEPELRLRMNELLRHQWVVKGYNRPVE